MGALVVKVAPMARLRQSVRQYSVDRISRSLHQVSAQVLASPTTPDGFTVPNGAGFTRDECIGRDIDIVTTHINYGFGCPMVAKY
jgi:hypothetical protein